MLRCLSYVIEHMFMPCYITCYIYYISCYVVLYHVLFHDTLYNMLCYVSYTTRYVYVMLCSITCHVM